MLENIHVSYGWIGNHWELFYTTKIWDSKIQIVQQLNVKDKRWSSFSFEWNGKTVSPYTPAFKENSVTVTINSECYIDMLNFLHPELRNRRINMRNVSLQQDSASKHWYCQCINGSSSKYVPLVSLYIMCNELRALRTCHHVISSYGDTRKGTS